MRVKLSTLHLLHKLCPNVKSDYILLTPDIALFCPENVCQAVISSPACTHTHVHHKENGTFQLLLLLVILSCFKRSSLIRQQGHERKDPDYIVHTYGGACWAFLGLGGLVKKDSIIWTSLFLHVMFTDGL